MRKHHVSFIHAWDGIVWVFRTQPNFRFHTLATVAVLAASWIFSVSRHDLVILLFTIMSVITAEMINTALEAVVDLLTSQYHLQAKIAKDVAAGMVLISAILAVVIGIVILGPYIIRFLSAQSI